MLIVSIIIVFLAISNYNYDDNYNHDNNCNHDNNSNHDKNYNYAFIANTTLL